MLLAVQHFDGWSLLNSTVSLVAAFVLGGIIGLERQIRQRTAGLRTNVLVAVGSALFVDLAFRLHSIYGGTPGGLHVLAYVVSGVGFLGAGVIMREEGNVRGINTAATLWGSAAVGAAAGADMLAEAILGTILVLSANTLLRPVVNRINRAPIDTPDVEVTNTFYVIALKERQAEVLAAVEQVLEQAKYPVREIEVTPFGEREVEVEAVLLATSVDGEELDRLAATLRKLPYVSQAFWSPSVAE